MPRRSIAFALALSSTFAAPVAHAAGALLSSNAVAPTEERVAIAIGPTRTTLWTSLRIDAVAGPVGLVLPVPVGAELDVSTDAWFEALEVATAPRVFPPLGQSAACSGGSWSPFLFETVGGLGHTPTLPVVSYAVADDPASVQAWAAGLGLTVPPALAGELDGYAPWRYLVVRFDAPSGSSVTETLRVGMPSGPARLPLALSSATSEPLLVTTWVVGQGHAEIVGGLASYLPTAFLTWDAAAHGSNYADSRATALGSFGATLLEGSSHVALAENIAIAGGHDSVDAVVTTYFERAALYEGGGVDSAACTLVASSALASSQSVAASCPRADLGVVANAGGCVEQPSPAELDPSLLRCGKTGDDLAVALGGLVPGATVLTRHALELQPGEQGIDWNVIVGTGGDILPIRVANTVDRTGCGPGSVGGGYGTGSGTPGGGSPSGGGPGSSGGGISGGGSNDWSSVSLGDNGGDDSTDGSVDQLDTGGSCDSSSPADTGSSGGCSGSGDSSSGACSGGGDASCDGGGGGGDCGGGGGGDCGGGGADFGSCSVGPAHLRWPRFSIWATALVALVAPLRRRGSRARRSKLPAP